MRILPLVPPTPEQLKSLTIDKPGFILIRVLLAAGRQRQLCCG
jgi:hypothetical protein